MAGIASLVVHGGALVALNLATNPDPVADQPTPKSRLNIESQAVDRVDAKESDASAETVAQGDAKPTAVGQGVIRQSKANAAQLPTQTSLAEQPDSQVVAALADTAATLKPTRPKISPNTALAARPQSVNASLPKAQKAALSTATGAFAAPSVIDTAKATNTTTDTISDDKPSLTLPAEQGTASLAWSGAGTIDPVSLAAIQAFTQPGDATQNTDTVRDGISAVLAAVPCARLQTTFIPETGELQLRGHIPDADMRGPILAALTAQVGSAIPVSDELLILPRPQCGALSGISNIGLPQSTDQITNPRVVGPSGFARNYTYTNGQRLTLDLTAPDYDGYIYVDYFTADGNVLHLQPNTVVPLEFAAAKTEQTVGKARDDNPFLELTISPPFGQEIAAAFASSVPLYEGLRPIQEPTGPYLDFLKERVANARANHPDFKGEWVYFFISTQEE